MASRFACTSGFVLFQFCALISFACANGHIHHPVKINAEPLDQLQLAALNGIDRQSDSSTQPSCTITFKGEEKQFESCQTLADFNLFWTLDQEAGEIQTAFQTNLEPGVGYLAFGYGYRDMVVGDGSVSIIAYLTPNGAVAEEYLLTSKSSSGVQPRSGESASTTVEADSDGSFLTGYFIRPLSASGLPTITPGRTDFIWAKGTRPSANDDLDQHSNRGFGSVDLADTTGAAAVEEESGSGFGTIFIVHGILMAVGWALVAPIAIMTARFLKCKDPLWFHLHRGFMTFVIVLVLVAYILGVVKGSHAGLRTKIHLALGTIALAGALIQAAGGVFRPSKNSSLRSTWRLAHFWSGRLLVLLAFANILLGLVIFNQVSSGYYIAVSVVFGFLLLIGVTMDIASRFKRDKHPDEFTDVESSL